MNEHLRIEALGREFHEKRGRIRQINLSSAPLLQKTLFSHPELQDEVYDSLEALRTDIREFRKRSSDKAARKTTDAYVLETIGYQLSSISSITFSLICMQVEKESSKPAALAQLMEEMIEFGSKVSQEMRNAVFLSILRNSAVPVKLKEEAEKALHDLHALGPIAREFQRFFEEENDLLREREDNEKDQRYTASKQTVKKLIELNVVIRAIDEVETIQRGDPKTIRFAEQEKRE